MQLNTSREEFRLQVAEAVGEDRSILEAVGRDWDGDVEHELPKDPSIIGREHREERADQDDHVAPDVEADRSAATGVSS